jgi:hypothetical protein
VNEISAFREVLSVRDATGLEPWPSISEANTVPEVRSLAVGVRRDQPADVIRAVASRMVEA